MPIHVRSFNYPRGNYDALSAVPLFFIGKHYRNSETVSSANCEVTFVKILMAFIPEKKRCTFVHICLAPLLLCGFQHCCIPPDGSDVRNLIAATYFAVVFRFVRGTGIYGFELKQVGHSNMCSTEWKSLKKYHST